MSLQNELDAPRHIWTSISWTMMMVKIQVSWKLMTQMTMIHEITAAAIAITNIWIYNHQYKISKVVGASPLSV